MAMRTFSLLLTLCLGSSVGIMQVPLRRTAVPASTSEGSVLLYHTIDVTIGTPPQKFNLTLDLGEYYAYVFDKKFHQTDCKQRSGQRRLFDRYSSTTYQQKTSEVPSFISSLAIMKDYCIRVDLPSGSIGRDVLSLSGASAKTNFAVIKQQVNASVQPFWPSDGVLGMIRRDDDDMGTSPIVHLATAAGGPVVTLFTGSDSAARPGVLTLGGTDTAHCDGAWTVFKQENMTGASGIVNWNVAVSSVKLGRVSSSKPLTAIMLSHTKSLVPASLFKQIVSAIDAEYDFPSDEYVVACSAVKRLPDLVLTLKGGFEYRVPAGEYVKNLIPRKDKQCTLLIGGLPDENPVFTLGWQMFGSYCWRFNYGANEFAIAKTKPL
ncbi:Protein ASP-7 [Aphelenchoides avenae]|nr:Protein ASP-7 [Aphelenchus avenae]